MSDLMETMIDTEELLVEDTMANKFLVFILDEQEFAIAIKYVIDIINVQPMTRIPNVPDFVRGITNLRGKVIPIIDVRIRFGKEPQTYNDRTCIIVVEVGDASVGMIIDQVSEVITLEDDGIAPPPAFNQSVESRFVQGISKTAGKTKLILDCKMLLDDNFLSVVPGEINEDA